MGFLTLPSGVVEKGISYQVSVSKSELALNSKVAADSYFSNSNVWNRFTATYQSTNELDHIEVMNFDATIASPVSNFLVSEFSIGSFRILNFVIHDFDGGTLELTRDDINVTEYDISMPLKIAPSQLVINVSSQTQFDVLDGSNYQSGFKVRLFNDETNSFEPDDPREISLVVGNIIHIESAFVTTVIANKHRLRFPHIDKCNNIQESEFYFNT